MEKKLDVSIYRLSGKQGATDKEWSTTYVYEPPDEESRNLRGKLFVVLDLSSPTSFDLPLASKLILDVLSESYYGDREGSPLKALEKSLLESKHRLLNVAFGSKETRAAQIDFNIVATVLWGTVVYIAKIGSVASYLLRAGKVEEVGPIEESNISVASGMVKGGDRLVLGSKRFREMVPLPHLSGRLPTLKKAAEELSFTKEFEPKQEIEVKNVYPVSASMVLLEFQLRDIPGEEEILQIHDLEEEGRPKVTWRWLLKGGRGLKFPFERLFLKPSQIYVRREREPMVSVKKGPPALFVLSILALVLLFSFSVVFTISRRRSRAHSAQIARLLEEARKNLEKSENLVDLNNLRAQEHLQEALKSLEEASSLAPKPLAELEGLKESASKLHDRVERITRLEEPDLLYDFMIQSKEANPVSLTGGGGALSVADRGEAIVYRLKLEGDQPPKVEKASSGPVKDPKVIILGAGRLFILGDAGLYLLNIGDGSVVEGEIALEEDWANVVSLDIYLDGLYLLSTKSSQIYRTLVSGNSFSELSPWLEEKSNLEDVVSMSIDGDIYVLKGISGEILKFSRGREVEFRLQGLETPLKEPRAIYTTPDSNFLYLLDTGNRRIIIVAKQGGLYQQQFIYTGGEAIWDDLKGLWVDEEKTVIYVLSGTRVYRVDY